MSKRIIYCADGTWESAKVTDPTNVYILYKALESGLNQHPMYDDGVGADGTPIDRMVGGAFGLGLFGKIKEGYTRIAQVYEEGDELFLFGFSRGAYTVRSLAGMIANCGLPATPLRQTGIEFVETVFNAYRDRDERQAILSSLGPHRLANATIAMIGVWDTVGSLGIPAIVGRVSPLVYGFLDTSLHPDVKHACHALAIDERRREFPATLWTGTFAPHQVVEQVWFAGVHGDVGGSYPQPALSDIPLCWMAAKARSLGVTFVPGALSCSAVGPQSALDAAHESWDIFWGFPKRREIPADATLGNSVQIRLQHEPAYRPANLKLDAFGTPLGYAFATVVTPPEEAAFPPDMAQAAGDSEN